MERLRVVLRGRLSGRHAGVRVLSYFRGCLLNGGLEDAEA